MARTASAAERYAQFVPAWLLLKALGLLPRRAALRCGVAVGRIAHRLAGGLRRTGLRNLELAMPELSAAERDRIVRGEFESLGRLLGAFSHLPKARPNDGFLEYRGIEHLDWALARGRGVLFLTGHFGGWEVGPHRLRLDGYPPVNFLVRRIDNPLVERLADRYRTAPGNRTIDKRDAARPVLAALRRGEMVGILADLNALDSEGVFVDFFGIPASTTAGIAALALRSGAAVVPGFTLWDAPSGRYVLTFEEPVELARTGSKAEDIRANTARFAGIIEAAVRRAPDQWLWIHKRWKTRPPGSPGLY